MNSITGNLDRDCLPYLWRKLLIFALVFLPVWNFTKVPYYIQFNKDGDTLYEKGGLSASVNLGHWIHGYQSTKLRSPACNFFLVHIAFGSTVLIMIALTLVKTSWRKKYGWYFFTFVICLSVHTLPASLINPDITLRIIFTFTCVYVIITALFGYQTLTKYDEDPVKGEKHLAIEYNIITFGAYGAGFAEIGSISSIIKYHMETGTWKSYGDTPSPLYGHTIYDILPEKVGMTFFFVFISIFWFYWPIKIVGIDTNVPAVTGKPNGAVNERTNLIV